MNTKIYAYLSVTLDGYIADNSGSVGFLEEVDGEGDNGFSDFYNDVELVVMGGNTYRWLIDNGIEKNPYENKKVIVVTSKKIETDWDIEFFNDDLNELEHKFKNFEKVWIVGGGKLISNLINLRILNSIYLTVAPFILSDGVSLFNDLVNKEKLYLRDVKRFNQFVELDYELF